ncbi:MAG: MFS transporter [Saprospiraceae bacterium]|nr:MFS transporter [Saprospiraceae bacterium]
MNKTIEQTTVNIPMRPPLSVIWIYACGQLGWSLASYGVGSLLSYFYMPPEDTASRTLFPSYIPTLSFLGLTLLGLISFSGRLFDAFIDPFVANWSDKMTTSFGKRKTFMAIAALPLAATSYAMFHPMTEGVSVTNALWLTAVVFVFYVSLAMYMIPYAALISELGHVGSDRLRISTIISITWALGFLIGNTTPALQGFFESKGDPSVWAFQKTVGLFALLSVVFLLVPVFFLDEKKYALQSESHENFIKSLQSVFQNRPFRYFATSYLLYWLALTFVQAGIIFYVTLLLGLDKSYATYFGIGSFFTSFLFYPLMGKLQAGFSKKTITLVAFLTFLVIFAILLLPLEGIVRFILVTVLAAFPLATFGILPNTFVADCIHKNEALTGKNQAGMFYAVAAFMMKVGISLANLLFPSLLVYGKSVENPYGVQLTVVAAFVFCTAGYFVFRKYEE